jgi:hypothetical protein
MNHSTPPKKPLIILMPVLEDRPSAGRLIEELAKNAGPRPFIVVAEDGSLSDPLGADVIASAGLDGVVLHLSRNMGHQRAIATGLSYIAAHYDAESVVVMDSDGEDKPEAIPALLSELRSGDLDLVVAMRRKRTESFKFRAFYIVYRFLFWLLTGREIRFGNFLAMTGDAARRLAVMQETWVHFPASVIISRLRRGFVPTDRGERYFGTSRMNFVSLALHGVRSIMVFAEDVLIRVGMFCIALIVASIALLGLVSLLKLFGLATPGWFSTAAGLLVIVLLQAGILSFVTLMVTGIIRSGGPMSPVDLSMLIKRVEHSSGDDSI